VNGGCSIVRRFDSPRVRYLCISLFADDTNLFYCNKSIEVLEQIVNNELDLLSTWFRANKLSLNVDKTNFILFKSRNKRYPEISVHIDGRSIKQVSHVKFFSDGQKLTKKLLTNSLTTFFKLDN